MLSRYCLSALKNASCFSSKSSFPPASRASIVRVLHAPIYQNIKRDFGLPLSPLSLLASISSYPQSLQNIVVVIKSTSLLAWRVLARRRATARRHARHGMARASPPLSPTRPLRADAQLVRAAPAVLARAAARPRRAAGWRAGDQNERAWTGVYVWGQRQVLFPRACIFACVRGRAVGW